MQANLRESTGTAAGFSLLELMVVLGIAGILFFVAVPGYRYAVLKSTRAAARATILDVMSRQEQYFINNKLYAASLDSLGLPEPYHVDGQGEIAAERQAAYRVSLEIGEAGYAGVRADPVNRQAEDSACMAYSLTRVGVRSVSGSLSSTPGDCW